MAWHPVHWYCCKSRDTARKGLWYCSAFMIDFHTLEYCWLNRSFPLCNHCTVFGWWWLLVDSKKYLLVFTMPGHMVICFFFPLDIVVPPGSYSSYTAIFVIFIRTVIPEILSLYLNTLVILLVVRTAASSLLSTDCIFTGTISPPWHVCHCQSPRLVDRPIETLWS